MKSRGARDRLAKRPGVTKQTANAPKTRLGRVVVLSGALIVLLVVAIIVYSQPSRKNSRRDELADAVAALRRLDWEQAEQLALVAAGKLEDSADPWWLAAQAAAGQNSDERVRQYCSKMLENEATLTPTVCRAAGELAFKSYSIDLSAKFYTKAIERNPSDTEARQRLLYLLGLGGRQWEAVPLLQWMVDADQISYQVLLLLGDHQRVADFDAALAPIFANNPADQGACLGKARIAFANQQYEECLKFLQLAERAGASSIEYHACLGATLFEVQDIAGLTKWRQSLSNASFQHPAVWRVLGKLAQQFKLEQLSYECFVRAVALDPSDAESMYILSNRLQSMGESDNAQVLQQRHRLLDRLMRQISNLYIGESTAANLLTTADLCQQLGRVKEAIGWYALVINGMGRPSANEQKLAQAEAQSLVAEFGIAQPWQTPLPISSAGLENAPALAAYWQALDSALAQTASTKVASSSGTLKWHDVSNSTNLNFNYFSSPNPESEGKRLYEFGGGGVGALDYDRDGWQDLFFTQGCQWPPSTQDAAASSHPIYYQTLYRNERGQNWSDVSRVSGAAQLAFGQGVACGDYDNDGFTDVYVACIGKNLLLHNNGDGTFSEVADQIGIKETDDWTTSCAIADVTGDGLPDIYDVNYLTGPDLFDRVCTWEGGRKRICGPGTFAGALDVFWHNNGEGFSNASRDAGIQMPNGKGLGIVVGDLDGTGLNSIFVANDQTPNFLFVPAQNVGSTTAEPWFSEEAQVRGVAYDEVGTPQGCMGIAVGDFNRDNLVDLFVTNYVTESNTLYQQMQQGLYSDQTRKNNLRSASLPMVGFGTQFVDARLDGNLDLLVTNGHLDDFAFKSQLYDMPTQYFANDGSGAFEEISSNLDGYFAGRYRGRGMAKLDWNADGLEDIAISHLDSPAALLENRTTSVGRYLALELVGTASNRDCVGATVRISVAGKQQTAIVTAGDGYQASNQKRIVFGLGSSDVVEEIVIRWPNRTEERYETTSCGTWIAIEKVGFFPR